MKSNLSKSSASRIGLVLTLGLVLIGGSLPATAGTVFEDEVFLMSCNFPGQAKRRLRIESSGRKRLRIEISNAPAGSYTVIIDDNGINRGAINVGALGTGEIQYDTRPELGELPLNFPFDVNTEIDLFFGGTRLAYSLTNDTACMNASGPPSPTTSTSSSTTSTSTSTTLGQSSSTTTTLGGDSTSTSSTSTTFSPGSSTTTTLPGSCQALQNTVSLVNCGAIRGAKGNRRVRVHLDCQRDVRYQISGVPNGLYSVLVTDVDGRLKRGTITATRNKGEIEFDDTPAVNELPLTFDPFGDVGIVRDSTGALVLAYPSCH